MRRLFLQCMSGLLKGYHMFLAPVTTTGPAAASHPRPPNAPPLPIPPPPSQHQQAGQGGGVQASPGSTGKPSSPLSTMQANNMLQVRGGACVPWGAQAGGFVQTRCGDGDVGMGRRS